MARRKNKFDFLRWNPSKWRLQYLEMEKPYRKKKSKRVKAGDVIGKEFPKAIQKTFKVK